jgi:hypothetical protein
MDFVLGRHLLMALLLAGIRAATPALRQVSSPEAMVHGITAIYNFGDSISDTGNLLREGDTGLLNYTTEPPYGITIGYPTGRCSDGYLMIDFLGILYTLVDLSFNRNHVYSILYTNSFVYSSKRVSIWLCSKRSCPPAAEPIPGQEGGLHSRRQLRSRRRHRAQHNDPRQEGVYRTPHQ